MSASVHTAPELAVAQAIVRRLDGDELLVDGEEWDSDATDEDQDDGTELILTGPDQQQALVRIRVEIVTGAVT